MAQPGHGILCMEYQVTGSYAVKLRAAHGAYTSFTGSTATPVTLSDDCSSKQAYQSVDVDILVEYGVSSSIHTYRIGFVPHSVQSAIALYIGCYYGPRNSVIL